MQELSSAAATFSSGAERRMPYCQGGYTAVVDVSITGAEAGGAWSEREQREVSPGLV
jgi:hypothetical protein